MASGAGGALDAERFRRQRERFFDVARRMRARAALEALLDVDPLVLGGGRSEESAAVSAERPGAVDRARGA